MYDIANYYLCGTLLLAGIQHEGCYFVPAYSSSLYFLEGETQDLTDDPLTREEPVRKCGTAAQLLGYRYFAVTTGYCVSGSSNLTDYTLYLAPQPDLCVSGIGEEVVTLHMDTHVHIHLHTCTHTHICTSHACTHARNIGGWYAGYFLMDVYEITDAQRFADSVESIVGSETTPEAMDATTSSALTTTVSVALNAVTVLAISAMFLL